MRPGPSSSIVARPAARDRASVPSPSPVTRHGEAPRDARRRRRARHLVFRCGREHVTLHAAPFPVGESKAIPGQREQQQGAMAQRPQLPVASVRTRSTRPLGLGNTLVNADTTMHKARQQNDIAARIRWRCKMNYENDLIVQGRKYDLLYGNLRPILMVSSGVN